MPLAKKQSRFSKINFKSPKTRIILTVAIFAVVGGGIMVFKSFASTMIGTVNADQITSYNNKSTKIADNYNGKTTANVWKVSVDGFLKPSAPILVPANMSYQVCYSVKGVGRFSATGVETGVTNGSAYQQYCGRTYTTGAAENVSPSFQNINNGGAVLYLQAITIQTAATSTPTPAPTK